jgi:hypothetical protein
MERIPQVDESLVEPRRSGVELARNLHAERLVQALVIEAVDEGIEPRLLLQRWPQRAWSPRSSASGASARIPFEPKGRLAQILKRRRFLGPKAYVFGGASGEYQGTIRTAWESLVLLANGIEPTRTRAHGRVNRDKLAEINLHWHDLRHHAESRIMRTAACSAACDQGNLSRDPLARSA